MIKQLTAVVSVVAVATIAAWMSDPSGSAQAQNTTATTTTANAPMSCPIRPSHGASRVIGGDDADPRNWPGFVTLRYANPNGQETQVFCGGALIDRNWVVTAAHCLVPRERFQRDAQNNLTRVGGSFDGWRLEVVEKTSNVTRVDRRNVIPAGQIIINTNYTDVTTGNDIALIRLARPATGPTMRVSMDQLADPGANSSELWVAGFGRTSNDQSNRGTRFDSVETDGGRSFNGGVYAGSRIMKEATLPLYQQNNCVTRVQEMVQQGLFPPGSRISPSQICAGFTNTAERPRDSCNGDSGGPLVRIGSDGCPILVGLVSYGTVTCGLRDSPAVYTRVSSYANWIRQNAPTATVRAVNHSETTGTNEILEALNALRAGSQVDRSSVQVELIPSGAVAVGGTRQIRVTSARMGGYPIVMDIDAAGALTYLYPNQFLSDPQRIEAGQSIVLPQPNAGFVFRAQLPLGASRVIVIISPDATLARRLQLGTRSMSASASRGFVVEPAPAADLLNMADAANSRSSVEAGSTWAYGEANYAVTAREQ